MPSKINEYAYEASTIDSKTITTSSTAVLAHNPARRSAVLVNTGATDVFLAIGRAAEAGKGICLKGGGGAYEITAINLSHAAVNGITASGTSTLSIHEGA